MHEGNNRSHCKSNRMIHWFLPIFRGRHIFLKFSSGNLEKFSPLPLPKLNTRKWISSYSWRLNFWGYMISDVCLVTLLQALQLFSEVDWAPRVFRKITDDGGFEPETSKKVGKSAHPYTSAVLKLLSSGS